MNEVPKRQDKWGDKKLILCFVSPGRVCVKPPGQENLLPVYADQTTFPSPPKE